tara:strand:+ start:1619 stop:2140 length:522 start_codon:yes stop_codon:yes gene_type:complete
VNRLAFILLLLFNIQLHAQRFMGNNGEISFFSEAPMEDIAAVNKKVSAVFDAGTKDLVFRLKITDFVFPKALMQEHFNENYLESDVYPTSTFVGKVLANKDGGTTVKGDLKIHGKTNQIIVEGSLIRKKDLVNIYADFAINLEDYNISIPKIVMYKIAEKIDIKVNIELKEIK